MNILTLENIRGLVRDFMIASVRTEEELRAEIGKYAPLAVDDVTLENLDELYDEMRIRHGVLVELGAALVAPGFTPWFDAKRRQNTEWFYWDRYRTQLAQSGFPGPVLEAMNEKTNRVIELCGDPKNDAPFDRRGMVMGDVQAGKTGNYTALISKAADVGYKVIIVIAGIHENLRSQTQTRIDEGLIGRNSDISRLENVRDDGRVGVGLIDPSREPSAMTTRQADFRKGQADQRIPLVNMEKEPIVFVIKKNASVLKNFLNWLKAFNLSHGGATIDQPMILIDDEADNASINVAKGPDAVSRINGQIRALLKLFSKSSYVAFTATPFANIFIDPDLQHEEAGRDLFPEDFLISLDRPGNYYGAEKVFLGDPEVEAGRPTRDIEDNEPHLPLKMPKGHQVRDLPESLMTAIRTFIVAGGIRYLRKQRDKHHSMLVNVSHLTSVQTDVANLIRHRLNEIIRPALKLHCSLPVAEAGTDPEITAMREIFDEEYSNVGEHWEDVLPLLDQVAARATVYEVNSKSGEKLEYPEVKDPENDQVTAIAVGGYSLSRGLTLEGLTISYFLRNSKAYDTLLQMARWFGYRPNYEDLCRVWIKDEARRWYSHIAEASEELRQDLRYMSASGASPRDFGLRVQRHPSALEVTARNKAGSGQEVIVDVSLSRSRIETTVIYDNEHGSEAEENRQAAIQFHDRLAGYPSRMDGESKLFEAVPSEIVKDYLVAFRNHPDAKQTQTAPVIRYIEEREDENLDEWDVVFVGSEKTDAATWEGLGFPLRLQARTPAFQSEGKIVATSRRFSSRGVVRFGMSVEVLKDVREEASRQNTKNIADSAYLAKRTRPILAVHIIALLDRNTEEFTDEAPVTAWTIGFPTSAKKGRTVSYQVNIVWWQQNRGEIDEEIGEALDREE